MSLAEALRAAARDSKRRSRIAQLRDVLDEIEAAKRAGVSNQTIVNVLNERGLQIDLNNFQISLHRLRKEREAQTAETPRCREAANGDGANGDQAGNGRTATDFKFEFTKPVTLKRSIDSDNK